MKWKTFTLILFSILSFFSFSQKKELATNNVLKVSYTLTLKKIKKNNALYQLEVWVNNTTNNNLYYKVPLTTAENGARTPSTQIKDLRFVKVEAENSTELFTNKTNVNGDKSNYYTSDNAILFEVKKGKTYYCIKNFRINKGVQPELKNSFTKVLHPLSYFDIKVTPEIISGSYKSSCGISITLKYKQDSVYGSYFEEYDNGVFEAKWIRKDDNTYLKSGNQNYIFRYYHKGNLITSIDADGKPCTWIKED